MLGFLELHLRMSELDPEFELERPVEKARLVRPAPKFGVQRPQAPRTPLKIFLALEGYGESSGDCDTFARSGVLDRNRYQHAHPHATITFILCPGMSPSPQGPFRVLWVIALMGSLEGIQSSGHGLLERRRRQSC